jgi:hypothetical protein
MALEIPRADAGTGGAAVAGRWDGDVTEASNEPRGIQLDLRAGDGGLSGRLTSEVNDVAVTVPIRRARYTPGRLGFLAGLGGEDRYFQGELRGNEIVGDVLEREGDEPVAKFRIAFVE